MKKNTIVLLSIVCFIGTLSLSVWAVEETKPSSSTPDPTKAGTPSATPAPTDTDALSPSPAPASVSSKKIRIGPSLKIGVIHPINLNLEIKMGGLLSGSIGGGWIGAKIESTSAAIINYDMRLRIHPWKGAFFIGMIFGHNKLTGDRTETITVTSPTTIEVPTKFDVTVSALYLTPHIGWMWVWDSGFMLGVELGWQFPISPNTTFDSNPVNSGQAAAFELAKATQDYLNVKADVEKVGNDYAGKSLPYVALIRFGWFF